VPMCATETTQGYAEQPDLFGATSLHDLIAAKGRGKVIPYAQAAVSAIPDDRRAIG